jgi:hypothetical protein
MKGKIYPGSDANKCNDEDHDDDQLQETIGSLGSELRKQLTPNNVPREQQNDTQRNAGYPCIFRKRFENEFAFHDTSPTFDFILFL